ncbi:NACHT domain-containing protein [Actinomadura sp. 7K534]|uniref:NACHT domain-containing protein n=1 Tax=Actinomadura sp. 7K534 TaxID=2530366 RepID=UPI00104980C0|nr:NACHT domain-containing protein [Actinomadura sp. 7K534]TDB96617.1 NACHT domain-containing protein [Actinomadura sp. 7K534]
MRYGRARKPWLVLATVTAGLLALAAITFWPLTAEDGLQDSANRAQLTGGFLLAAAVAWTGVAVWSRRRSREARTIPGPADLEQAAALLAQIVEHQWKEEAALRSLDDPDPIPVTWQLVQAPGLMDHHVSIEDTAAAAAGRMQWQASSAAVPALADRFRSTRRRRLVILGAAGMGKTTLAVQLLLHLLKTRTPDEPVPVLLPIAGWDTTEHLRLHEWLAERLLQDYPALRSDQIGAPAVNALTAGGHILPVLDGLDELSPTAQAQVITALNRSLGGDDQLILTSRTLEFADAVAEAGDVITSAAVMEARPLEPAEAADYLELTLPPVPAPTWHQILTELRTTPTSPIAQITKTPLGLWLLRTVYIAPGADPAPLADPARFPTPAALQTHLFDQLIPAVITARPPSKDPADHFRPRKRRDPEDTRRWLAYLAHILTHPRNSDSTPRTRDLAWWHLARHALPPKQFKRRVRALIRFVTGSTAGLSSSLVVGLSVGPEGRTPVDLMIWLVAWLLTGLVVGLAIGVLVSFLVTAASRPWSHDEPGIANLNGRITISLTRRVVGSVALILTFAIFLIIAGSSIRDVIVILTIGFIASLAAIIIDWLENPIPSDRPNTPLTTWRGDRLLNITRIIVVALPAGCAIGVAVFLLSDATSAFLLGGASGPLIGLAMSNHRAWVAYRIVVRHLAKRGLAPRDLMRFLDDAHKLGLLRAVGPVYQFRHAEFQDHLASAHQAAPPPMRRWRRQESTAGAG